MVFFKKSLTRNETKFFKEKKKEKRKEEVLETLHQSHVYSTMLSLLFLGQVQPMCI